MIYLDNNATTRPADAVVDTMGHVLRELWGNPSSVHRFGQQIRQRVELARQQTARLVGAEPARLTFTSGGAEANNLALRGTLELAGARPAALITTALEHATAARAKDELMVAAEAWYEGDPLLEKQLVGRTGGCELPCEMNR